MSDNFDWRTDEEDGWSGPRPVTRRSARRRRWLLPLAILAALLAAGTVVTWQLRERLSTAEAAVKDEVIASFHLVRAAEADGDIELFRNLLSGSDLAWANAQLALFDQGRLFDLSPLGLGAQPESLTDLAVTLSPELNSAEMTAMATYAASVADGGAVRLRQTAVYRHGERWIWSPPRPEFWGPELSSDGHFLQVSYPRRDERLALRLAQDLDELVEKICAGDALSV